jgi:hypothetical protein
VFPIGASGRVHLGSQEKIAYRIDNWRNGLQWLTTGCIAVGVGILLQEYAKEYMIPLHIAVLVGAPGIGVALSLPRIRERIRKLGSALT